MRVRRGIATRLLHVDGEPVVVRAWQRRDGEVAFHACRGGALATRAEPAQRLELAIERMRFALGVDDDYRELYDAFRADPPARSGDPAPAAGTGRGGAPGRGRPSPGRSPSS